MITSHTSMTDDLFGFEQATLEAETTKFASGVLSPAIWAGYVKAGRSLCIAASQTGHVTLQRALDFAAGGGTLLVDSGAFVYRNSPDKTPWAKILDVYRQIAEAATGHVTFVLPDVVGSQEKTLAILDRWGAAFQTAVGAHEALLPVQVGNTPPDIFIKQACLLLSRPIGGLALPSNAAAFPPELIATLGNSPGSVPRRVHFLGISRNSKGLQDRLFRLAQIWPDAKTSCDACEHRAAIGEGKPITMARREVLSSMIDCELEEWDETEDDGTDAEARTHLRNRFPDLEDDDIDTLICSGWGEIAQISAFHNHQTHACGPKATTDAIYQFATQ